MANAKQTNEQRALTAIRGSLGDAIGIDHETELTSEQLAHLVDRLARFAVSSGAPGLSVLARDLPGGGGVPEVLPEQALIAGGTGPKSR